MRHAPDSTRAAPTLGSTALVARCGNQDRGVDHSDAGQLEQVRAVAGVDQGSSPDIASCSGLTHSTLVGSRAGQVACHNRRR